MAFRIIGNWLKWSRDWDALCNRCGKCCYIRTVEADGIVVVHYDSPCENLDTETHLCRIYEDRFRKCDHCGKVGAFTVLFNPHPAKRLHLRAGASPSIHAGVDCAGDFA